MKLLIIAAFFFANHGYSNGFKVLQDFAGNNYVCNEHELGGFCVSSDKSSVLNYTETPNSGDKINDLKKTLQDKINANGNSGKIKNKVFRGDYWYLGQANNTEIKGYKTQYLLSKNRKKTLLFSISHKLDQTNEKLVQKAFKSFTNHVFKK